MEILLLVVLTLGTQFTRLKQVHCASISDGQLFQEPHVFLTLNSEASVDEYNGDFLNRLIEVNWYNLEVNPENWIGVFRNDPNSGSSPIIRITPTVAEGSVKTNLRFDVIDFHEVEIPESGCMGYWVVYFNVGLKNPTVSNCFKVFPNWMSEMREIIGDKKLTEIMIPGTHDSGAWKEYEGKIDDINLGIKYSRTQEDSFYTQLIHGIRYFDLRVAHYPETDEIFWLNHGDIRIHPLQMLIDDVKDFIKEHKEILVLDIHSLPVGFGGLDDPIHRQLIDFLETGLRNILYLKTATISPTLNEIWNSGKTVLLTYPNELEEEYPFLWPNIVHLWGNKNNVAELGAYFDRLLPMASCQGRLFSAMAELTPTAADIILRPEFGLRGFAQLVNLPVTQWFRKENYYSRANIVSTDYYLGNDIIQIAMAVNLNNKTCPAP